jgi:uncharacterized membrane protein
MKRYFKVGIATIVPLLLVVQVFSWLFNFSQTTIESMVGQELPFYWTLIGILGVLFAIFFIGVIFTHINFVNKIKRGIERRIINHIPVAKTIYGFGNEIVDTFVTDIKEDGDMTVIEVDMAGFKLLGVLTDKKNNLGFIISAPSPLTGIVIKLPNYRIIDMKFIDVVKINTSLGRINGDTWK